MNQNYPSRFWKNQAITRGVTLGWGCIHLTLRWQSTHGTRPSSLAFLAAVVVLLTYTLAFAPVFSTVSAFSFLQFGRTNGSLSSSLLPQSLLTTPDTASQPRRILQPLSRNVTVAIVVDNSGSMRETDRENIRLTAARLFVDLLDTGDSTTVISFSSKAEVQRPGLTRIAKVEDRQVLKSPISTFKPSGNTDYLAALDAAFRELDRDASGNPKFVVFLTDGEVHPDGWPDMSSAARDEYMKRLDAKLKEFRDKKWAIYPISLMITRGEEVLGNIAEMTRGRFSPAPTPGALNPIFQGIFATFKGAVYSGFVEVCDEMVVPVDRFSRQLIFSIIKLRPDLKSTLTPPPATDPSSIEYRPDEFNQYEVYVVSNPSPGNWKITKSGAGCLLVGPVEVQGVRVNMESPRPFVQRESTMKIRTSVERQPQGSSTWEPLSDATVSVEVTPPGSLKPTVTIPLIPSGGGFEAAFSDTRREGDYALNFVVRSGEKVLFGVPPSPKFVEVGNFPAMEAVIDVERPIDLGRPITFRAWLIGQGAFLDLSYSVDIDGPDGKVRPTLEPGEKGIKGTFVPSGGGRYSLSASAKGKIQGKYGLAEFVAEARAEATITVVAPKVDMSIILEPAGPVDLGRPVTARAELSSERQVMTASYTVDIDGPDEKLQPTVAAGRATFVPKNTGKYSFLFVAEGKVQGIYEAVPFKIEKKIEQNIEVLRPELVVDLPPGDAIRPEEASEPIAVTAAFRHRGEPVRLQDGRISGTIKTPSGEERLDFVAKDSRFEARFVPRRTGLYRLDIAGSGSFNGVALGELSWSSEKRIEVVSVINPKFTPTDLGWLREGQQVTRTLTVESNSDRPLTLRVQPLGQWLQVEPQEHQVRPGGPQQVTLSFSAAREATGGLYQAGLAFSSPQPGVHLEPSATTPDVVKFYVPAILDRVREPLQLPLGVLVSLGVVALGVGAILWKRQPGVEGALECRSVPPGVFPDVVTWRDLSRVPRPLPRRIFSKARVTMGGNDMDLALPGVGEMVELAVLGAEIDRWFIENVAADEIRVGSQKIAPGGTETLVDGCELSLGGYRWSYHNPAAQEWEQ